MGRWIVLNTKLKCFRWPRLITVIELIQEGAPIAWSGKDLSLPDDLRDDEFEVTGDLTEIQRVDLDATEYVWGEDLNRGEGSEEQC